MTRTVSAPFVMLLILLAAMQALLAAGLYGWAFAIGDSGSSVPVALQVAVSVLGMPGMLLSDGLRSSLGDPRSIYVGFALGGLAWSVVLGSIIILLRRRRRSRNAPMPYTVR